MKLYIYDLLQEDFLVLIFALLSTFSIKNKQAN